MVLSNPSELAQQKGLDFSRILEQELSPYLLPRAIFMLSKKNPSSTMAVPSLSSARTVELSATTRHKRFSAFSIAIEEIKRLPDLSPTYKELAEEWLYKDVSDRKAALFASKSSANRRPIGPGQKISEGHSDPTPRESKRPSSADPEPHSSCAYPGSSSVTPLVASAGDAFGPSPTRFGSFRLSHRFFKIEKVFNHNYNHCRILPQGYAFRPDLLSSSNNSAWHLEFQKIDRDIIKSLSTTKRFNYTIAIMNFLHTLADIEDQMTLPRSTILTGPHIASMSNHCYTSVTIRQLERCTIQSDRAFILINTLKEDVRGLYQRGLDSEKELVMERGTA